MLLQKRLDPIVFYGTRGTSTSKGSNEVLVSSTNNPFS